MKLRNKILRSRPQSMVYTVNQNSKAYMPKQEDFERPSHIYKVTFGDLKPEAPPVFGYPLINYSPVNSAELDKKD